MTCVVLETSGYSVFVVERYPMPGIVVFNLKKKNTHGLWKWH